jgi:hypothetical protein
MTQNMKAPSGVVAAFTSSGPVFCNASGVAAIQDADIGKLLAAGWKFADYELDSITAAIMAGTSGSFTSLDMQTLSVRGVASMNTGSVNTLTGPAGCTIQMSNSRFTTQTVNTQSVTG